MAYRAASPSPRVSAPRPGGMVWSYVLLGLDTLTMFIEAPSWFAARAEAMRRTGAEQHEIVVEAHPGVTLASLRQRLTGGRKSPRRRKNSKQSNKRRTKQ